MHRFIHRAILAGLFPVLVSGCLRAQAPAASETQSGMTPAVAPSVANPAATRPHVDNYVIGIDDVLSINVWKEADLSKSVPVRSDGKISLPLAGEVVAAGRTPLQLESEISDRLKSFITTPEVSVMVQEINSQKFNILGQVSKPGSYSLTLASTIVDAIALAGGFKDFAKQKGVYVLRQAPGGSETRIPFNYKDFIKGKSLAQNIKLEPHDTVVVP